MLSTETLVFFQLASLYVRTFLGRFKLGVFTFSSLAAVGVWKGQVTAFITLKLTVLPSNSANVVSLSLTDATPPMITQKISWKVDMQIKLKLSTMKFSK